MLVAAAMAVLAADQLTKAWAVAALDSGPVHVLGPLRLALVYNKAGAFGLGGAFVPFLAVAALAVVLVMAATGSTATRPVVAGSLGLLVGGAVGNVVDRLFRGSGGFLDGAVVDFVDLGFWPVFNVADSAITCGCLLLLWGGSGPAPRSEGRSGPDSRSEGRSGPAPRSEGRSGPAPRSEGRSGPAPPAPPAT